MRSNKDSTSADHHQSWTVRLAVLISTCLALLCWLAFGDLHQRPFQPCKLADVYKKQTELTSVDHVGGLSGDDDQPTFAEQASADVYKKQTELTTVDHVGGLNGDDDQSTEEISSLDNAEVYEVAEASKFGGEALVAHAELNTEEQAMNQDRERAAGLNEDAQQPYIEKVDHAELNEVEEEPSPEEQVMTQPVDPAEGSTNEKQPKVEKTFTTQSLDRAETFFMGKKEPKAEERFTMQPLDHAHHRSKKTFQQRYFWVPPPVPQKSKVIFFYAGNEASVEAYVQSCGLMWENAGKFNAALVFAEHRFWGHSIPSDKLYELAGPDQAIDDYIMLIASLVKNESANGIFDKNAPKVQVVAFGGSYGGMLAAWMRLKYPKIIDAAVASSAPVLAFPDHKPLFHLNKKERGFYKDGGASYWRVVTDVYSDCAEDIHRALARNAKSLTGQQARVELGLCDDDTNNNITDADVLTWIAYSLETMAMGDYSFPSSYITGRTLPARPAKLACYMFNSNKDGGLRALRDAIGVMYNDTKSVACYRVPNRREASFYDGFWDQYWCRWLIPQETYFQMNGPPNDMFLPLKLDWIEIAKHCQETIGVVPDGGKSIYKWFGAVTEREWARKASRIVFANGGHDPWNSGGYYSRANPSLRPIWIPSGAHHAELMFSRVDDPDEIIHARRDTMRFVKQWLARPPRDDGEYEAPRVRSADEDDQEEADDAHAEAALS